MPGCWPPTPPLPTTCVAARPATSIAGDAIREHFLTRQPARSAQAHDPCRDLRLGTRAWPSSGGHHDPSRALSRDKSIHKMLELVRQRLDLARPDARNHQGDRTQSTLALLASVPNSAGSTTRRPQPCGVAPFVHKSGTMVAPARIHGGRAAVRRILYMAAVAASRHNPVLRPFYDRLSPKVNRQAALIAVLRRLVVLPTPCSSQASPGKEPLPLDT